MVEESLQANPEEQEVDLEKVENDEHEEIVENTEKSEEAVKESSQTSKSLESPFVQILSLQKLQSSKKNWLIFGSGYKVLLKSQQQALVQIKNIVITPLHY